MRVLYEITATVRDDLCEAFERYMTERHIYGVIATGAFENATFSRSAVGRYRVTYTAASRAHLEEYLLEHAPRLRDDVRTALPEGVEISREEWELLESF